MRLLRLNMFFLCSSWRSPFILLRSASNLEFLSFGVSKTTISALGPKKKTFDTHFVCIILNR